MVCRWRGFEMLRKVIRRRAQKIVDALREAQQGQNGDNHDDNADDPENAVHAASFHEGYAAQRNWCF
jgi:hypothetical protein